MCYRELVLFLASTCLALAASEQQIALGGGLFPLSVAGAPWVQITNFAADGGPGGVDVSYRDATLKIDVYLFDAGDPSWVGKSLDERFVLEATSITGVLREIERRGIYSDVKCGSAGDTTAGRLSFTHIPVTYSEKGEKRKSHYYLAKYRDRLLKVRITALESVDDLRLEKAFSDAVSLLKDA